MRLPLTALYAILVFFVTLSFGIAPPAALGNGRTYEPPAEPRAEPSMVQPEPTEPAEAVPAAPVVKPDPLRAVCAYKWNSYYEEQGMEIRVSTKGDHNEMIVFFCQSCHLEEHFVVPFLYTEYQGKTGMERIKECGFTVAVFRGRGINEITFPVE